MGTFRLEAIAHFGGLAFLCFGFRHSDLKFCPITKLRF